MEVSRADEVDKHRPLAVCQGRRCSGHVDPPRPCRPADGRDGRCGCAGNARDGGNGSARALVQRRTIRRLYAAPLRVDVDDEQAIPIEAKVERREGRESPDEEARSQNEHERQRDLHDDQSVAEARAAFACGTPSLRLQRIHRLHARRAKCRRGAEEHGGCSRDARREGEDAPVEPQIEKHIGHLGRQLLHQQRAAPPGEEQASGRARAGEEHALGQQLAGQPRPRRPEREPDAQLVPPRGGARELKVRDVRTRDEQDERDDDHDRRQGTLVTAAKERAAGRPVLQRQSPLQVVLQILPTPVLRQRGFANLRLDAAERGSRPADRLIRLEADHHVQPRHGTAIEAPVAAAHERFGAERNRDVEHTADVGAEKVGTDHAHDRERHALDSDRSADDVGRTSEPALPEAIADNRHGTVRAAAAPIVRLGDRAPDECLDAKRVEVPAADPGAINHVGRAGLREIEPPGRPRECALEQLAALANLFPDGVGPRRDWLTLLGQQRKLQGFPHR
jgi:hypothetical protein